MYPETQRADIIVPRVVCSCSVLIACLLFLSSCSPFGSGTVGSKATVRPTHVSTPTTTSGKAVSLWQIHMFNVSTGWAMTSDPANKSRILHTASGVAHWQDVTPTIGNQDAFISGKDFFDPLTAWVTVAIMPNLFVYRTLDGGQTWQKFQLPDHGAGVADIFFLDMQNGWILVSQGAGGGNVPVDVLHTSDGGATWKVISLSNRYNLRNPQAIPFGGESGGLTFVNPNTGWITGFTNAEHTAWLYITHDGGVTWQHQVISLPANAYQITTFPPIFFTATTGELPVIIPTAGGLTTNIYVTHDAGTSWQPTTPVPADGSTIDSADATHSWIVDNTTALKSNQYTYSTLYSTTDGGAHWISSQVKLSIHVPVIDFISPMLGWATSLSQWLYQTTDGGHTWTKLTPTVM